MLREIFGDEKCMLLDLFITHYDEAWEIGKKNFDILALQQSVDWDAVRVTLVHDGTEPFPDEYFAGYPYKVTQVELPHGGIAAARNWCIDHSTATWIKWCDFDDTFASIFALEELMNAMRNGQNFDLLWFKLVLEKDGKWYKKEERDPVVIHGKAFRRSFLISHNVRFPEYLTWCEDSAFLARLELEIDHSRIGEIQTMGPMYMFVVRQGSLCNRKEIWFSNRKSFFLRHQYVEDQLREHGDLVGARMMVVRIMGDSYFTLHEVNASTPEEREEHERAVWEYFKQKKDDFLMVSKADFDMALAAVNRESESVNYISKEDVLRWIKELRQKYEGGEE